MRLTPGAKLGPYEILSALGAGAMGEVFRARDTRLRRDVAIKVLPEAFSTDADRLFRFEQEARAAAALNHPNILAVFDIGHDAGAPFIVSELLEGATLRDRLDAGAIPQRKAIAYAVAIARGLAAAHDKGIVHRDLKPANLFVTADDQIKILDFGLAKLTDAARDVSALQTMEQTQAGAVLGTAGYMSPEQVRGAAVDHRADLFSLGAILYELVSGRRAFLGESAAETMAAIVNETPPDLRAADRPVPPALTRIIERCLEKHPAARFQTASDLAFALETAAEGSSVSTASASVAAAPPRRGWIPWAAAALLLVTLGPLAYQRLRERTPEARPIRFQIPPTVEYSGPSNFSVSPDGRHLAFFALGADGLTRIWIRAMDAFEVRPLAGTEVFPLAPPPFWSPDGRFIAFDSGGKLKKVDIAGGPPETLCELPSVAVGGTWNRDGDIVIGNTIGGLFRLRETGGALTPVTALDPARKEEFHLLPTFLPDGRHFIYLRVSPAARESSGTYVGTLDAAPAEQPATRLLPYAVGMTYAPAVDSGSGHLLFLREGTLMAQPFDEKALAIAGPPVQVTQHVGSFRDGGLFAVSANDRLIYRTAAADMQLAWVDRRGAVSARISEPGGVLGASLSPDGTRAVVSRIDPQDTAKADLWLLDLAGGGAKRFTFGAGIAEFPLWSPDGTQIVFTVNKSLLHRKPANGEGSETLVLKSSGGGGVIANGWSSDGGFLIYSVLETMTTKSDLWVWPTNGGKPMPFLRSEFQEGEGRFSPDRRWVAYVSNESGANEVYVRTFAEDVSGGSATRGGSVLVSRGGGSAPRWRADGRQLFYASNDGKMMAVEVSTGATFHADAPATMFRIPLGASVGDLSPDAQRFLSVVPAGATAMTPFTVVLNWTAGLKK